MSAQGLTETAATSPPQAEQAMALLQGHHNQQNELLARDARAERMLERRAARRRDGALGEAAARACMRDVENSPGGLAGFLGNLSVHPTAAA